MTDPIRDDELSAYLADELNGDAAAAFEERLAVDATLRTRLDALATALYALGGEQEPPAGFTDRLAQRLQVDRDGMDTVVLPPPVDLQARRRASSRGWWAGVGSVAAVLVAVAVVGGNLLAGGGGGEDASTAGGDLFAESATEAAMDELADDGAESRRAAEGGAGGGAGATDAESNQAAGDVATMESAPQAAAGAAPKDSAAAPAPDPGPSLIDTEVALDEASARRRFRDVPEASDLLGTRRSEARSLARQRRRMLADAPPFGSGTAPGSCIDRTTEQADSPVVPARVETAVYDGRPALVHVVVTASEGSRRLDRIETWVFDAERCTTLFFAQRT